MWLPFKGKSKVNRIASHIEKNNLESDLLHFFNLGRAYYNSVTSQIEIRNHHQFAFFFYEDAPSLREEIALLPNPEYLKSKIDISYFKARKFLNIDRQRNYQGLINWVLKDSEKFIIKRYNICQIGFTWGGILDRHNHNIPSQYPSTTVTYFINIENGQGLDFRIYEKDQSHNSIKCCVNSNCTRVIFDSNKDHDLVNLDGKIYLFVLFNSVDVIQDEPAIRELEIPLKITVP